MAVATVLLILLAGRDSSLLVILGTGLIWAWSILRLVRSGVGSGGGVGGDATMAVGLDSDGDGGDGGGGGE
ncbi:hypothetical protein [Falsiroseomonas sp.]|uniref:hypothetical protein n=1 Tax=Falsiroseomonas sp. TaxID=2870721 RepID=UPI003F710F74